MKIFNHPNIIWLHEIIDDPDKGKFIYLVTEYHSNGSIGDLLRQINFQYDHHNIMLYEKEDYFDKMISKGLSI